MKQLFLAFSALALASCAAIEPQQFNGPNGKPAYSMKCSGMGRTLDACYQKAGEICPAGYNIVDKSSGLVGMTNQSGGYLVTKNSLAIECK